MLPIPKFFQYLTDTVDLSHDPKNKLTECPYALLY